MKLLIYLVSKCDGVIPAKVEETRPKDSKVPGNV